MHSGVQLAFPHACARKPRKARFRNLTATLGSICRRSERVDSRCANTDHCLFLLAPPNQGVLALLDVRRVHHLQAKERERRTERCVRSRVHDVEMAKATSKSKRKRQLFPGGMLRNPENEDNHRSELALSQASRYPHCTSSSWGAPPTAFESELNANDSSMPTQHPSSAQQDQVQSAQGSIDKDTTETNGDAASPQHRDDAPSQQIKQQGHTTRQLAARV